MRSFRPHAFVLLAGVLALAACGDEAPRYSLQQVMYQIEFEEQAMRQAAFGGDLAGVLEAGSEIRRWMRDPAVERFLQRPNLPKDRAAFEELQAYFDGKLDELLGKAERGDIDGVRAAYGGMRMSCDVCHRDFRPGGI